MELCEVPCSVGKKGSFAPKDAEQDLRRLLGQQERHALRALPRLRALRA